MVSKEYDIEEIVHFYERFIENVEQFSLEPQAQIEKLKKYVVADEIALDFSEIAKPYAIILYENEWITDEHVAVVYEIDEKLEAMSKDKTLWSESALLNSNEWRECRILGQKLLSLLKEE